jgi:hypothetical protein
VKNLLRFINREGGLVVILSFLNLNLYSSSQNLSAALNNCNFPHPFLSANYSETDHMIEK